jgi:hypothetical protein
LYNSFPQRLFFLRGGLVIRKAKKDALFKNHGVLLLGGLGLLSGGGSSVRGSLLLSLVLGRLLIGRAELGHHGGSILPSLLEVLGIFLRQTKEQRWHSVEQKTKNLK